MPLRSLPDSFEYSSPGSISQDNRETKRSKNVLPSRSKNVPRRRRQSAYKDARTLQKISSFLPPEPETAAPSGVSSSVSSPTPSQTQSPTPSNDNLIPVWDLTGDSVKAVCAAAALLIAETPAVAFTFNLTPEAIEKAKGHPAGFLDSLKRSFDKELKRAGIVLPYWFVVDTDKDGRLHIQGAVLPPQPSERGMQALREAMKAAWGEWQGPGKHKQLRFKELYSDGWAIYCMRNQRKVAKVIGPRTFTVTQPLGRDAKWVYGEVRRIMRLDASPLGC